MKNYLKIMKIKDEIIKKFLQGLKDAGLKERIEKIYLFGSRARGDEKPYSDYDLLIVTPFKGRDFRSKIYDVVIDILLETQRELSLKIFRPEEFERLCRMKTPFTQHILKEGIRIG